MVENPLGRNEPTRMPPRARNSLQEGKIKAKTLAARQLRASCESKNSNPSKADGVPI
jgi:hypothetical protein